MIRALLPAPSRRPIPHSLHRSIRRFAQPLRQLHERLRSHGFVHSFVHSFVHGFVHGRLPRRRLRTTPRFYLLLLAALCLAFGLSCGLTQLRSLRLSRRIASLIQERSNLDMQLETLNKRLAYVQSDAYVQRVARDELNMLYPGEIRYIPD